MAEQLIVASSVNSLRKKLTKIAFVAVMIGAAVTSEQAFACCCQMLGQYHFDSSADVDCQQQGGHCVDSSQCNTPNQQGISHSSSWH